MKKKRNTNTHAELFFTFCQLPYAGPDLKILLSDFSGCGLDGMLMF